MFFSAAASLSTSAFEAKSTPPQPPLTNQTRTKEPLIPLDKKAFCYHKDSIIHGTGHICGGSAATKAENQAFINIINFISNRNLSDKQKVQALIK